jgi:hypothetical protein
MFKREAFLIFKHYKESGSIEFCVDIFWDLAD